MEKYIVDEWNGLEFSLIGDYSIVAGNDEPPARPIGIRGVMRRDYLINIGNRCMISCCCQVNQVNAHGTPVLRMNAANCRTGAVLLSENDAKPTGNAMRIISLSFIQFKTGF